MTNLDPVADRAVRDAVDAFMEGRLTPELPGETVFETKNSRYRLLDGIVYAAPDDSLIGSELVGWLMESRRHSVVESAWQPGSRAVLVDRHRGRNIIVTSTTRLLHLEEHVSTPPPSFDDDRALTAPFSPRNAPIVPSTPPPTRIAFHDGAASAPPTRAAPVPKPPAQPAPARPASAPKPAAPSAPVRPAPAFKPATPSAPARSSPAAKPPGASPILSAAAVQKRAAAIHLPPRPIAPRPAAAPSPQPARSLPIPAAPPHPKPPAEGSPPQVNGQREASDDAGWEITSSEFEMEGEVTRDAPVPLVRPLKPEGRGAPLAAALKGPREAPLHGRSWDRWRPHLELQAGLAAFVRGLR